MSAFTRWLAAPPADAAIEFAPEGVSAVTLARGDTVQASALEPLPPGALTASLTADNIVDSRAVATAMRTVLERLPARPKRVALLIPDVAARVSLVRFERVPSRPEDLDQLVRWQVRKSAPFPIEEAVLSYVPGTPSGADGREFLVVLARAAVVRGYETVCEQLGLQPGLVDLSTFGAIDLLLADMAPAGDWLVVHMRPEYMSLAIMRGRHAIFFRTVAGADGDALADAVHQTTMYYQDRLAGQGFARVWLGGVGRTAGVVEQARRSLEGRVGQPVQAIDVSRNVQVGDRGGLAGDRLALLAPLVGILLRMRAPVTV